MENVMIIGLCLTLLNALVSDVQHAKDTKYNITVLTYPAQTLSLPPRISRENVQHKKSDFSPSSLKDSFAGQDVIISTMAGGDFELQIRIADSVAAAGVKRFIPHEFGHDTLNPEIQARISKYAGRARVLKHLQQLCTSDTCFQWTAIATGYTLDASLINDDLGFDLEWYSATMHGIGTEPFAASSLERVGHVVRSAIKKWDQVKNQYIYAAGVITSANEVLRSAEKVTGHEWTVGNYDVEDCIREGKTRIERGFPDAGMCLLERSILYDEELDATAPFRYKSSNKILGLAPESVETIVQTAYHDFKHHGKPGCGCSS